MKSRVPVLKGITVLAIALAAGAAFAEDEGGEEGAAGGGIDDRPYLGVLGGITEPDEDRPQHYDEVNTYQLIYGSQKSEKINTEISLAYSILQYNIGTVKDAHDFHYTLGYDWLWFLNRDGWMPFGLAGAGVTFAKREPSDDEYLVANVGAGVMKVLSEHGVAFRAEARYLFNFDEKGGNDQPQDWRVVAGLTIPLKAKPVELPPPPPAPAPAVADSDGDGVIDSADKCPDTLPNVKVDGTGCAIPQILKLNGVNFEFDSSKLDENAKTILDEVSDSIKNQPTMQVEIAGHTDSVGEDDYNLALSQRRVDSVRAYLVERGAPADKFTAKGYGETEPVASNDTDAGRAENRRVEFRILAQ